MLFLQTLLFLHVTGAITLGFYLLLPLLLHSSLKQTEDARLGQLRLIRHLNRIGQYILLAQLATGGYLLSLGTYSTAWMTAVITLFIGVGAAGGMLGVALRRVINGRAEAMRQAFWYSAAAELAFVLLLVLKKFPQIL
ncbi:MULTISPECIES: hypothetical protein [unclassified Paenibacillus]|uniref:hypothetical protein n=1 Tax=unclassified Paenibacillus TaxID=185978 RepID=UPI00020D7B16|nr:MULTISPECIES: hypothetical protein [unclassified Paenibacillus]EGL14901.1 hypothetical protein HMPREF9413_1915 [Paenibacillus sp. HGF7]